MLKFDRTRRSWLVAGIVAGGWILSAGPVRAQDATQGWLFNLSGVGKNAGATLADDGIYLTGRYLGEGLDETAGGRKQGISTKVSRLSARTST